MIVVVILVGCFMLYLTPDYRIIVKSFLSVLEVKPKEYHATLKIKRYRWNKRVLKGITAMEWHPERDDITLWAPVMCNYKIK